ncbi:hypothetical protein [Micromonospora humida]|uniref:Sensor histidine kinase n=1 Tax=Micromonospora humida TaxID=2809018 RepID=A0ABS2IZC2_9ACTN|nr:hypothetical protein [Micromonospora humida]MBM7079662.1 hypothetical protein [Micromonospora humida]
MSYRRRDARPRLALWMLVALGDVVLLLLSAGVAVLVVSIAVVTVAAAGVAAWRLSRRTAMPTATDAVTMPLTSRKSA